MLSREETHGAVSLVLQINYSRSYSLLLCTCWIDMLFNVLHIKEGKEILWTWVVLLCEEAFTSRSWYFYFIGGMWYEWLKYVLLTSLEVLKFFTFYCIKNMVTMCRRECLFQAETSQKELHIYFNMWHGGWLQVWITCAISLRERAKLAECLWDNHALGLHYPSFMEMECSL